MRFGIAAVAAGCVAGCVLILVPSAAASARTSLVNHKINGTQSAISCLSATRCVAVGYNSHGVGDVVPISHGKPGTADLLHGTGIVSSVSCPGSKGCVALAQDEGEAHVRFVKINSHGHVTGSKTVTPPTGVSLAVLACTSLTSCVVGGTQFFSTPMSAEVGVWNGSHLTLHRVHGVKNASLGISGAGCDGSTCWVVGAGHAGAVQTGVAIPVTSHKVGSQQKVPGIDLQGVACSSTTHCYAAGYPQSGGSIVALSRTKVGGHTKVSADTPLMAIGCHGSRCTAVGEKVDASSMTSFEGVALSLHSGHVTSTHAVGASGGFTGVAQPSSSVFVAVGASSAAALGLSEVTTG